MRVTLQSPRVLSVSYQSVPCEGDPVSSDQGSRPSVASSKRKATTCFLFHLLPLPAEGLGHPPSGCPLGPSMSRDFMSHLPHSVLPLPKTCNAPRWTWSTWSCRGAGESWRAQSPPWIECTVEAYSHTLWQKSWYICAAHESGNHRVTRPEGILGIGKSTARSPGKREARAQSKNH